MGVIASALDRLMDLTVAPGYSRLGYAVRSRDWDALPSMAGRAVLVTGATGDGIGRAAAIDFARLGAGVIVLARDEGRGTTAVAEIAAASGHGDVSLLLGDLSSLASVRRAAQTLTRRVPSLDVLVNNAGVMAPERTESEDGIELTFATNVVGPFLLTGLLTGLLEHAKPARVINVSSGGMYGQALDLDDLQTERTEYRPAQVYARSKRAEVVLTEQWAGRLRDRGIVVHAMHPGWADTPGVQSSLPGFRRVTRPILRTPAQGADTIVWLGAADEPAGSSGAFWHDRRRRPVNLLPTTRTNDADAARLWDACMALSGLPASS